MSAAACTGCLMLLHYQLLLCQRPQRRDYVLQAGFWVCIHTAVSQVRALKAKPGQGVSHISSCSTLC